MKQLHFIVQAKGGVGKSLLTYLFGLTKQQYEPSLFVDVEIVQHKHLLVN